jgi:DNA invertase Pin-like site-specific DNA recombinase
MPKPKRAALYLRVSTDGQTVENQRIALEAMCEQRGWQVVQAYSDSGVSGSKGRHQRPGLDAMLKDASRGRFNVVLAWALDRLGRSLIVNRRRRLTRHRRTTGTRQSAADLCR